MQEEFIFKTTNATSFDAVVNKQQYDEVGISFNGAIKINEDMSVITKKNVKVEKLNEAKKTYQKVMEMRELTDEERKYANKARQILGKMFAIMFYNKKIMIAWTALVVTTLGMDIASGDILGIALRSAVILLINRPIKFLKEVGKILNSEKRKEELAEYLRSQHVLGYVDSVDNKEDIKLYIKVKGPTSHHE